MQENEPYYICTAWLRESNKQWEFYGVDSKMELEGLSGVGYPQFSSTNHNQFRLWFCNTWDYTHENGWECMDRAGTMFENKEYSIGKRHRSGFAENWVTKKGESRVYWTKTRGTGFTLHKFATPKGSRNWYRLSVTGNDEILGSLGNNYFWHAKHSASKSTLVFRFGQTPLNCDEKFL
jgi:hypothetical protein